MRAWLLPDWWEDEIAASCSGAATLESYIARMTGLTIQALRSGEPLTIAPAAAVRFKKRADAAHDQVAPAAAIAEQVAKALVEAVDPPGRFEAGLAAGDARQTILAKWPVPNLDALLDFAWDNGVIVAHMAELPDASKKFDGLTLFVDGRPVIILASGRDSPAWLAFDTAHELGHIMLGHVTPDAPISDVSLESMPFDPEEQDANRYALELLTGDPDISFPPVYGLTGMKLARIAQSKGSENNIDPGVLTLVYGRSANRLPAAQNALNCLGQTSGAHVTISAGVRRHLKNELPESVRMLVRLVTES